jgi:hypothetical protein
MRPSGNHLSICQHSVYVPFLLHSLSLTMLSGLYSTTGTTDLVYNLCKSPSFLIPIYGLFHSDVTLPLRRAHVLLDDVFLAEAMQKTRNDIILVPRLSEAEKVERLLCPRMTSSETRPDRDPAQLKARKLFRSCWKEELAVRLAVFPMFALFHSCPGYLGRPPGHGACLISPAGCCSDARLYRDANRRR